MAVLKQQVCISATQKRHNGVHPTPPTLEARAACKVGFINRTDYHPSIA